MAKILLIVALVLLAPVLIALLFGIAAFLFKVAIAAGVIALVVLGVRKLLRDQPRTDH